MSVRLTKIFATKDNSQIRISCSYDSSLGEISDVKVTVFDGKTGQGIDMTKIWDLEPFLSVVDDINWDELELQKNKMLYND